MSEDLAGEGLRGGLTAQERSEDRRRRVLAAALELFGTRGFAAVPVDQICRSAGISTKSFYPLFDHKEALFLQLYDDLIAGVAAAVIGAEVEGTSPSEAARRRLDALAHSLVDDPRVARVVLIESGGLSPMVEERRRAVHRQLADFVATTTVPYVAGGDLPDRDYRRAALGLVGAINEVVVDFVLAGDPGSVDILVDDLAELFTAVRLGLTQGGRGE